MSWARTAAYVVGLLARSATGRARTEVATRRLHHGLGEDATPPPAVGTRGGVGLTSLYDDHEGPSWYARDDRPRRSFLARLLRRPDTTQEARRG